MIIFYLILLITNTLLITKHLHFSTKQDRIEPLIRARRSLTALINYEKQMLLKNAGAVLGGGHASLHLAVSVGRSVRPSVTFLNSERFSHYCFCPTVRDWIAVYPALF